MIRSSMPTRSAPIKRATTIRASGKRKPSRPKMTPARANAKGQDCTLQLPGCQNDTATVVLCHLRMFGGGGMGCKPDDSEAVFACRHCHDQIDSRTPVQFWSMEDIAWALIRTLRAQRAAGVLMMKGEK